jgi:hypothetical protein
MGLPCAAACADAIASVVETLIDERARAIAERKRQAAETTDRPNPSRLVSPMVSVES